MPRENEKQDLPEDEEVRDLLEVYELNDAGIVENIPLDCVKFPGLRAIYFRKIDYDAIKDDEDDIAKNPTSIRDLSIGQIESILPGIDDPEFDEIPVIGEPEEIEPYFDSEVENSFFAFPIKRPLEDLALRSSTIMKLDAFSSLSFLANEEFDEDVKLVANLYETLGHLSSKSKTLPEDLGPNTKSKIHNILHRYFDASTMDSIQSYYFELRKAIESHLSSVASADFSYLINQTPDGFRVNKNVLTDQQTIFAISIANCSQLLSVLPTVNSENEDLDKIYLSKSRAEEQGKITETGMINHKGTDISIVGNKEYVTHVIPNYLRLHALNNKLTQMNSNEDQAEFASELIRIIKTQLTALKSGKASQSLMMLPGAQNMKEKRQKNNPKKQLQELQRVISDTDQLTIELEMVHMIQLILACYF